MRLRVAAVLAALVVVALGCPRQPQGAARDAALANAHDATDASAPSEASKGAPEPLVTLSERATGPRLAWRGDGGLVAYVGGKKAERALSTIALGPDGRALGPARGVVSVPTDATALLVRKGRGTDSIVAWSEISEQGESLHALVVRSDGRARGAPVVVAQSPDDIVWFDFVATSAGGVMVWAEQTRGNDATVLSLGLDDEGRARGVASPVARSVLGWQVVRANDGAGLALLRVPPGRASDPTRVAGTLAFQRLDALGRAPGPPVEIAPSELVGADFDIARFPRESDGLIAAWTDRRGADPEVKILAFHEDGVASPAIGLDVRKGGRTLVGLHSGEAGITVLWDEARRRPSEPRRVHHALLRDARVKDTIAEGPAIEACPSFDPEMRVTRSGVAWVFSAPRVVGTPCSEGGERPAFLRFGKDLAVEQSSFAGDPSLVASAWGLDCEGDRCGALAAAGEGETRVYFADLAPSPSTVPAPVATPSRSVLGAIDTLMEDTSVSDVASSRIGDARVLAVLARPERAPADAGLTLSLSITTGGVAQPVKVLSSRALASGGLAMAPAPDGAVIAWTYREGKDAHVHLAKIDASGKRLKDIRLTNVGSEKSDVALAAVSGGFVVGWIDTRDGNAEVYATRVSMDLVPIGRETRVTRAPGDASDLAVASVGDAVIAAWADPRESPSDAFADIYVAALAGTDAHLLAPDARVLSTAAHSRSPVLSADRDVATLAWIEEAPATGAGQSDAYGAMVATLDARGHAKADPARLRLATEGLVTGIRFDDGSRPPRAIVTLATPREASLALLSFGSRITSWPIVTLAAPPTADVPVTLVDRDVFYGDDGPESADARLRHVLLSTGGTP